MPRTQVLVVEDEEHVREVLLEALEKLGYAAVGMASGADALAQLPGLHPKLILLDIMMPDMSGIQFLARLRANPLWTHVPVIIISGIGDELLAATPRPHAQLPGLGVVGILQKPVRLATVIEHVSRAIGPPQAEKKPCKDGQMLPG